MRPIKKEDEKKIKISISIDRVLNHRMENDMINKSKLIDNLLKKYYENFHSVQNKMQS
jgi:hypothetical protein